VAAKSGLVSVAGVICAGIVDGLYRARDSESYGALGWAVDFPIEEAGFAVRALLEACPSSARKTAHKKLMEILSQRTPEWAEDLKRTAEQAIRKKS
jgi:hypothetical protein